MDEVFIERLSLKGRHGVHHREREREQEFLIDIRVFADLSSAALSDRLEDTVDYGQFRKIAEEAVQKNSFYLIERLADTIAKGILDDSRVERVEVTVRKPAVYADALPGITITRSRT